MGVSLDSVSTGSSAGWLSLPSTAPSRLQEVSQGQWTWTLGHQWAVSFPGLSSDRASPGQLMRSSAISG